MQSDHLSGAQPIEKQARASLSSPLSGKIGGRNFPLVPTMLNHAAWVTTDMAATADFYTRILGMEIANVMIDDHIPSTGEPFPHFHLFFRMADGSTVAFFEAPGLPPEAKPTHPAYELFNHFAMQVDTPADVHRWREWLLHNGLEVVGPTDHKGAIYSIYFHDPNGIRLELTAPQTPQWNTQADKGRRALAQWTQVKERALADGKDVGKELLALTSKVKSEF